VTLTTSAVVPVATVVGGSGDLVAETPGRQVEAVVAGYLKSEAAVPAAFDLADIVDALVESAGAIVAVAAAAAPEIVGTEAAEMGAEAGLQLALPRAGCI